MAGEGAEKKSLISSGSFKSGALGSRYRSSRAFVLEATVGDGLQRSDGS